MSQNTEALKVLVQLTIGEIMKKMYYAKQMVDVCFVIEEEDSPCDLKTEAKHWLQEESRNVVPGRIVISEVKSLADIPKMWWSATYWGDNEHDNCASDFLQDPEYKEYLRLKAKFESNE